MNQPLRLLTKQLGSLLLLGTLVTTAFSQEANYTSTQLDQFMKRWKVLGPIPLSELHQSENAARKHGFEADLLAENGGEAKLVATHDSSIKIRNREYQWRSITSEKDTIDLQKELGEHEWATAYAAARITADEEQTGLLGIGSDDAVRIWLNGDLVHDNWTGRPVVKDDDLVRVKLRKGENRLLLKVLNRQYGWGFTCRFLSKQQQTERLVRAAAEGQQDTISELLKLGVDVNGASKRGITAFHAAKLRGFEHIAKFLVSKGADANVDFSPDQFLDSMLKERMVKDAPGVAVLASRGGKILYSQGFGMASVEHDVPVTTKTKFRIGSVSKQFTAAAILKLQEQGKLSTDDPLNKFIPDYPRGDEVTVHHLLTHTSGIHSFTSKPEFFETVTSPITTEDMIASFKDDPYDFSPGEKWQYNNSGYFLLGFIVEKISDKSFDEYLRETFFEPLGMHDTGVHTATAILKHEATGYSYSDEAVSKSLDWDMSRAGGAGNLYSTVEDLHRWNEALFGGKVLSDESLKAAFTPVKVKDSSTAMLPYGYGWINDSHRGLQRIWHDGGLHGFLSRLQRFPDQEFTVVVLHNGSPPLPGFTPSVVAELVVDAYLWQDMKPRPRYEVDETVEPETYDAFVGRYQYGPAVMAVTKENNRLFAQLTGQEKYEIFPSGGTKFFWKVVDAQVEFLRDDDGKVNSARHTQGGATFVAPRVKEEKTVKVDNATLDLYVGKYKYKALGVLTVRRKDNQLLAQMEGQPEFEIYPKSETKFFWKVVKAEIEFVNKDGKVEKAIHTQGGGTIEAEKIE